MNKITIIQCDRCNKRIPDLGLNKASPLYRTMFANCLCDNCAFWNIIVSDTSSQYLIVDGLCYNVMPFQPDPPPGAILGSHGKVFYFLTKHGEAIRSNDTWVIGTVPPSFKDYLPDNAYLMNRKAYWRFIERQNIRCTELSCPNRYSCLFYDYTIEYSNPQPSVSRHYIPDLNICSAYIPLRWIHNYQGIDLK